ncbi:snurportin-1 protein [Salvia divinorum]|uniref:Snurportin-1 protein n=1 Tax=Salvia divinorum TaxID=28513 RepID=A0ABD1FNB1_SALDI
MFQQSLQSKVTQHMTIHGYLTFVLYRQQEFLQPVVLELLDDGRLAILNDPLVFCCLDSDFIRKSGYGVRQSLNHRPLRENLILLRIYFSMEGEERHQDNQNLGEAHFILLP